MQSIITIIHLTRSNQKRLITQWCVLEKPHRPSRAFSNTEEVIYPNLKTKILMYVSRSAYEFPSECC